MRILVITVFFVLIIGVVLAFPKRISSGDGVENNLTPHSDDELLDGQDETHGVNKAQVPVKGSVVRRSLEDVVSACEDDDPYTGTCPALRSVREAKNFEAGDGAAKFPGVAEGSTLKGPVVRRSIEDVASACGEDDDPYSGTCPALRTVREAKDVELGYDKNAGETVGVNEARVPSGATVVRRSIVDDALLGSGDFTDSTVAKRFVREAKGVEPGYDGDTAKFPGVAQGPALKGPVVRRSIEDVASACGEDDDPYSGTCPALRTEREAKDVVAGDDDAKFPGVAEGPAFKGPVVRRSIEDVASACGEDDDPYSGTCPALRSVREAKNVEPLHDEDADQIPHSHNGENSPKSPVVRRSPSDGPVQPGDPGACINGEDDLPETGKVPVKRAVDDKTYGVNKALAQAKGPVVRRSIEDVASACSEDDDPYTGTCPALKSKREAKNFGAGDYAAKNPGVDEGAALKGPVVRRSIEDVASACSEDDDPYSGTCPALRSVREAKDVEPGHHGDAGHKGGLADLGGHSSVNEKCGSGLCFKEDIENLGGKVTVFGAQ